MSNIEWAHPDPATDSIATDFVRQQQDALATDPQKENEDESSLFHWGVGILILEIVILSLTGWRNFLPIPYLALSIWLILHQSLIFKRWYLITGKALHVFMFYPLCIAISLIGFL
jgi:hypothetical protein